MIVCAADVQRRELSPQGGLRAVRTTGAGGQWTARVSGVEGNIYGSMHPIYPMPIFTPAWNTSHKVPRAPRTRYLFWGVRGTHPAIVPCTRRTIHQQYVAQSAVAGADNHPAPKQKGRSKRPMLIPRPSSSSALAKAQGLPVASPQSSQALQCALQVRLPPQRPSPAHTPR